MTNSITRNPDSPSGVVEYVVTDDATLTTAHIVHTIGGVTIEHDGYSLYIPVRMIPAIIATMGKACDPSEDGAPTSYIVRCETNQAERVTRTMWDAEQTADRCLCDGEHAIRPSFVSWASVNPPNI